MNLSLNIWVDTSGVLNDMKEKEKKRKKRVRFDNQYASRATSKAYLVIDAERELHFSFYGISPSIEIVQIILVQLQCKKNIIQQDYQFIDMLTKFASIK